MVFTPNPTAFPKLDDAQIKTMSQWAKLKVIPAGSRLYYEGEVNFSFFIVKSGIVKVMENSRGLKEVIAVHEAGSFTGEIAMLTGRPAIVTAYAETDCEVYEISAEDLRRILNEMPRLSEILLRAFIARREMIEESGFASVQVIGSRFSQETHRIREFLAKNKIPYRWIDLERDPQVDQLLAQFKITAEETPVVICINSNRVVKNPSNTQMAECLGIRKPLDHTVFDLVIVGAGPAGLAAAVYGASEGLKTLLLDRLGPGGQAGTSSMIENYMGFPTGLSGADLANRALIQAEKFGATLSAPADVVRLSSENGYHMLHLDNGEEISAKCVLISAGVSYRRLAVEGSERFEGAGIYYAATPVEAEECRSSQVLIIGGGNSAGQAAVYLAERASKVFLLIRGDRLEKSMSQYLVRRIEQTANIEIRRETEIKKIHGDRSITGADLFCSKTKEMETVSCMAVFVFVGATPHTQWLSGVIQVDEQGFVKTGTQVWESGSWTLRRQPYFLETNCPGIFAAGDVRHGSIKRVASAVGEGSMAVQFIHEYLALS